MASRTIMQKVTESARRYRVWAFIIPVIIPYGNPWSANDWELLRSEYDRCQATSPTALHYYICTDQARDMAEGNTHWA